MMAGGLTWFIHGADDADSGDSFHEISTGTIR